MHVFLSIAYNTACFLLNENSQAVIYLNYSNLCSAIGVV